MDEGAGRVTGRMFWMLASDSSSQPHRRMIDLKGHRTIGLADPLVRMRIPDLTRDCRGTAFASGRRSSCGIRNHAMLQSEYESHLHTTPLHSILKFRVLRS